MKISKMSRENLNYLFHQKNMQIKEIATYFGLTKGHVSEVFKKYNISTKRYVENYFDSWSANMAYILGFITADGCISSKYQLGITLQKRDMEILNFIQQEICPNNIYNHISFASKQSIHNQTLEYARIRITCAKIIKSLNRLGIYPKKSGNEIFIDIPKNFIPDYIRGLMDGDGCITIGKVKNKNFLTTRVRLSIASKEFLKSIQEKYLLGLGKIYQGNGCYYWEMTNRKEVIKFLRWIYNGNFCLKRKYQKFLEIVEYDNKNS